MYTRPDVAAAHKDTGEHLVGVVSDGEGVQSQELSIKESQAIAKEAKNGGFDPEKHGITKDVYLAEVRVDYLNQAVKAGLTAATITAITQLAAGKMTSAEMGVQFVDTLVVSSGYLVSMKIGGAIAQALFPELPGIGFAIGSLLGCSVAVVYNIGMKH